MRRLFAVFGLLAFLAVQPLAAQPLPTDAAREPVDGDILDYTGNYKALSTAPSPYEYGTVVGPYKGVLLSSPTTPAFTMYCVDFEHYVLGGSDGWEINASNLADGSDVSQTFGESLFLKTASQARLDYQKAAFLSSLFATNTSDWAGIHGAIWTLTRPGSGYKFTYSSAAIDSWLGVVNTAYLTSIASGGAGSVWDGFDFQNWHVMTPTGLNAEGGHVPLSQEFLVHTAVVPEPQTYILLLSGLVAIFFVARRRMKENGYA